MGKKEKVRTFVKGEEQQPDAELVKDLPDQEFEEPVEQEAQEEQEQLIPVGIDFPMTILIKINHLGEITVAKV